MVKWLWWLNMNFDDKELTLLSEEESWGVNGGRQLDVLDKYGTLLLLLI